MTCRPSTLRPAVLALALIAAALGNLRQLHARAALSPADQLPEARLPRAGERVLVFAPHPDDEVLALGGILHESQKRGARIQVAYLTSGDGFRLCAAAQYRRWPSPKRMRRLAVERQAEARAALAELGLSPASAVFLGYPDRGLSALWLTHWTAGNPYRSPYTSDASVSSRGDARGGAPFCGESALRDVDRLLSEHRPEIVYFPDSTDDHPDHWAAHCLVQLALERRAVAGGAPMPERRTYLIHRGAWPSPLKPDPSATLEPPAELRGPEARWRQSPLTRDAVAAKIRALAAYRSQQMLAGNFLSAFVRRNELTADWPGKGSPAPRSLDALHRVIAPLPPAPADHLLRPGSAPEVLWDATKDRFARKRCGAVDFTGMEVRADMSEVRLSAMLRRPAAAWATYDLYWKPAIGPVSQLRTRRYRLRGYRCEPADTRFEIDGGRLEVTIPRSELHGSDRIMVSAAAWSGPALLDRTAWRMVKLR